MTKSFAINWMNLNGNWRATPGPIYPSKAAAIKAMKQLGLYGNPAYKVVEV